MPKSGRPQPASPAFPSAPQHRSGQGPVSTKAKPRNQRRFDRKPPEAYETAVRLLAIRPHSGAELRQKLRQRGCAAEAIDAALSRATEMGYLDDAAFASSLVRRRSGARGRLAIAAELAQKGLSREAVGLALGEMSVESELEAAVNALRKQPVGVDPHRIAARLQRRGFSPDVVRRAFRVLNQT